MSIDLRELEQEILAAGRDGGTAPAVFILGAPRTGSTFLYQALVSAYRLPFVDNMTNTFFSTMPTLGVVLGQGLRQAQRIRYASRYGKVDGLLQPSEGSAVMAHWFGGGHPSQVVSTRIREGLESHLTATLRVVQRTLGAPLVIKNAWNCFRIEYLAAGLPEANFIWIRRDIGAAAKSDLAARYAVHGSPEVWNSATPANVETLRSQPYWEQVVENQYEFSKAISTGLGRMTEERWMDVWYEDLTANPQAILDALGRRLALLKGRAAESLDGLTEGAESLSRLSGNDAAQVDRYIDRHSQRLSACRRTG